MDISNDFELVPVQNTELKVHKEVQTSSGQVKMFRTIGTQTKDVLTQRKPSPRNTDDTSERVWFASRIFLTLLVGKIHLVLSASKKTNIRFD